MKTSKELAQEICISMCLDKHDDIEELTELLTPTFKAIERLREEIEFLRRYGTKECTRMADQALAEHRAASDDHP